VRGWRLNPWALLFSMALMVPLAVGIYLSVWWTVGVVGAVMLVVGGFLLFVSRTKAGAAVGQRIAGRLYRTRLGKRFADSQMRVQARRKGVPLTDASGRKRSPIELQLDLYDTPEIRLIKQQLKGMNPVQRMQALRMMEAQTDAVRASGQDATRQAEAARRAVDQPRPSGRPVSGPPRSRSRKRRRRG
jgi:hypothetical protein